MQYNKKDIMMKSILFRYMLVVEVRKYIAISVSGRFKHSAFKFKSRVFFLW